MSNDFNYSNNYTFYHNSCHESNNNYHSAKHSASRDAYKIKHFRLTLNSGLFAFWYNTLHPSIVVIKSLRQSEISSWPRTSHLLKWTWDRSLLNRHRRHSKPWPWEFGVLPFCYFFFPVCSFLFLMDWLDINFLFQSFPLFLIHKWHISFYFAASLAPNCYPRPFLSATSQGFGS